MRTLWFVVVGFVVVFARGVLLGAETIPPAPENHFNDFAGVVAPSVARQLNSELAQFERDTTNQIVVAVYPHMLSDSSIEDYTVRVAQRWGVGTKEHKNGAVLFVFTEDHQLFVQVGYGLEGALPDALCKRIIEDEITPRFRRGDYSSGLAAGTRALIAAAKGEYRGTGRTVREARGESDGGGIGAHGVFIAFVVLVILFQAIFGRRRNVLYNSRGRRGFWGGPGGPWWGGGGGGGGWGGGGGGGGGGTFSGGGGSFGGGGAGGRW